MKAKKYKVIYVEFSGKADYKGELEIETDINPELPEEKGRWVFMDLFHKKAKEQGLKHVSIYEIIKL